MRQVWNRGLKGEEMYKHYKNGRPYTFEKKNEFSKNRKGIKQSMEQINKRVESMKGYKHSEETKNKISRLKIGKKLPPFTKEHKNKISLKLKAEKNGNWQGDNVGCAGIHQWVSKRKIKPLLCEFCNKKESYDIANINNHQYTRNINDYKWLCRSCHKKLDNNKEICKKGHRLKGNNVIINSRGHRVCRICRDKCNHVSYMKRIGRRT